MRYENLKWLVVASGIGFLALLQYSSNIGPVSKAPIMEPTASTGTNHIRRQDHRVVSDWKTEVESSAKQVRQLSVEPIRAPLQSRLDDLQLSTVTDPTGLSPLNVPKLNQPVESSPLPHPEASSATTTKLDVSASPNPVTPSESPLETVSTAANFEAPNTLTTGLDHSFDSLDTKVLDMAPQAFQIPEPVQVNAAHHIEYGKTLARRGALYSAQREFYRALRDIAQAIDQQTDGNTHSRLLEQSVRAMSEANDFFSFRDDPSGTTDVHQISSLHSTRIVTQVEASRMTPPQAMQAYYSFAKDRMIRAAGGSVVAAEAHYCLGKLYTMRAKTDSDGTGLDFAKAMVHHGAAFATDSSHYRSANELGVLLAKSGHMENAKNVFKKSLRLRQMPETWGNLASVHQSLGEERLASLAALELQRMLKGPPIEQVDGGSIRWVDPQEFGGPMPNETTIPNGPVASSAKKTETEKPRRTLGGLLKKLF